MSLDPYNEWISIFHEDFRKIWTEERTELRKINMICCAFEREVHKINESMKETVTTLTKELKKKDWAEKKKKFVGLAQSERYDVEFYNKENQTPCIELVSSEGLEIKTENVIEEPRVVTPPPSLQNIFTFTSPVLHKRTFGSSKRKKSVSPQSPDQKSTRTSTPSNLITPKNPDDSNIMECSIIDDTPESCSRKTKKRSRLQLKKQQSTRLNEGKQKITLTQMFFEPKKMNKSIDSDMPSMTVSEMINLINESSSESGAESDATVDNLEIPPPTQGDPTILPSTPSPSIVEIEDGPNYAYQEVVRGKKERQKLKGWSCNECKEYYEGLNLSPTELQKKKDQCSKHRSRFQPREETFDGFWDLSFGPTPRAQDEQSLVFGFKKQ